MKIALVRRDFSRTRGGAENYLINLAEGLVGRGHEVHVFAANYDDLGEDPRFRVHKVPVWRFHSSVRNLTFAENAARLLRAERFDIINGLSKIYYQDIYRIGDPLYICWLKLHPWGILDKVLGFANPRDRTLLYLEKKIFDRRNHRRIIAISELDKRLVCKFYRSVDPERVKVIYNGVDFEKFSPANRAKYNSKIRTDFGISEDAAVVLYISMDWKRKGYSHLLQAVSLLPAGFRQNVRVLVVGKGEPEKYEKAVNELGLEDNVVYAGVQENIEQFYAAGDVFVLPTLYDPFANVHLEALASGVPVITTAMAGGAEIIEEGLNGYVVSKASAVEEISAAIEKCLSPRRREGMRAAAPASISGMTWDRNLDRVLALYEEVCEEKRGNGGSAAHRRGREIRKQENKETGKQGNKGTRKEVPSTEYRVKNPGLVLFGIRNSELGTRNSEAGEFTRRVFSGAGFIYNVDFEEVLAENGLEQFYDFYNLRPEEIVKHVRDERMTGRVSLKVGGAPRDFYLKRTVYNPWVEFFRTAVKWTRQFNNAVHEFEICRRFFEAGLPAPVPVAAGKRGSLFRVETFCLTAGLGDTGKLEDYVPERFAPPLDGERVREKHELARKVGRLARKMHDAGFNHRDFYLCHIRRFADSGELAILDLNRAGFFPGGVPERWVVKDIAALDAGPMPDGIICGTDRLRCFKAYLGRDGKITESDRELLKKIVKRADSLRVRGEKSRKRDAEYMAKETGNER